ncbi:MAG: TPM domain-containing protein [Clostridiales bacterium]|nr:TPM domain-containing protein [Clostridiales bacterium]
MKKIFGNRAVAWIVLILVVAGSVALGLYRKDYFESKKQTKLLDVKYYTWVCDDASILSEETENAVKSYDTSWNSKHEAVVAVATLPRLNRWEISDYAEALGEKWKLGSNDMLLLLVKDSDWYVSYGQKVSKRITSDWEKKFKSAVEEPFFTGNADAAVTAFMKAADEFYSSVDLSGYQSSSSFTDVFPIGDFTDSCRGMSAIKIIVIIFVVIIVIKAISKGGVKRMEAPTRRTTIFPVFIPPIVGGMRSTRTSGSGQSRSPGSGRAGFGGSARGGFSGPKTGFGGSSRGGFGKGGFGSGRR